MKNIILLCTTVFFLVCLFVAVEIFLRFKADSEVSDSSFFTLEVCSHDGRKISGDGILKLRTDLFAGYKNFPSQKTEWFSINSYGFRGAEIDKNKKNKKRIIMVGGSAMFGTSVYRDDDTLQAKLQRANKKYEVINAGVPGFLSGQELAYIVSELEAFQPDIIISYNGFNDLDSQWHHEFFFGGKPKPTGELGYNSNFYWFQIEDALVNKHNAETKISYGLKFFLKTFVDKSVFLLLIKNKYNLLRQPRSADSARGQAVDSKVQSEKQSYFENIVHNYTNNLIKMRDFCQARNIMYFAVLQPELGNKKVRTAYEEYVLDMWAFGTTRYKAEFPPLYKKFLEETKIILTNNNVAWLDINQFPEFAECKETLFGDVVHANAAGHQVVADIINDYLGQVEKP